jgi:hypothetical protein
MLLFSLFFGYDSSHYKQLSDVQKKLVGTFHDNSKGLVLDEKCKAWSQSELAECLVGGGCCHQGNCLSSGCLKPFSQSQSPTLSPTIIPPPWAVGTPVPTPIGGVYQYHVAGQTVRVTLKDMKVCQDSVVLACAPFMRPLSISYTNPRNLQRNAAACRQQCLRLHGCIYGVYMDGGARKGECWLSAHRSSAK